MFSPRKSFTFLKKLAKIIIGKFLYGRHKILWTYSKP